MINRIRPLDTAIIKMLQKKLKLNGNFNFNGNDN
jgi:hypothetical protein